jgi:hypothetical protein
VNLTGVAAPEMPAEGCLALLWPRLAECLVAASVRSDLEDAAAMLPPIPRLALELRLGAGEDQVDLHQLIVRDQGDGAVLARQADRFDSAVIRARGLQRFLKAWACGDDAVLRGIERIFLEWDSPRAGGFCAAPAIFLPVDLTGDTQPERLRRRQALSGVLTQLQEEGSSAVQARILEDPMSDVAISHIGIMGGRGNALRVNYRGLPLRKLSGFLRYHEWPGDIAIATAHFDALVDMSDRVTVALDAREHILPSIGFEIFMDHPIGASCRWSKVFDYFQQRGLCTQAKRDALRSVRGRVRCYADGMDWPAAWIVASVRAPADVHPSFHSDVSHLKLTIDADAGLRAKAYITGQHFWGDPPPAPRMLGELPRHTVSTQKTQERAVRFLCRARQQNGLWGDFNGYNGGCGMFATAWVGWVLARCGSRHARRVAENIVPAVLRRQRSSGGWGHNDAGPADSDDTASVLKFLQAVGFQGPQVGRALAFLREHHLGDGGFTTYGSKTSISFGANEQATDNWRTSHLCVAANCAPLLGDALLPLLRGSQNADGSWSPFWWRTPAYATAMAAEALASVGSMDSVAAAVRWAYSLDPATQTVFDAACIVRILCLGRVADRKAASALLNGICDAQLDDGSWATAAEIIVPRPDGAPAESPSFVVPDDQRVFTTATVIAAITALRTADLA